MVANRGNITDYIVIEKIDIASGKIEVVPNECLGLLSTNNAEAHELHQRLVSCYRLRFHQLNGLRNGLPLNGYRLHIALLQRTRDHDAPQMAFTTAKPVANTSASSCGFGLWCEPFDRR